MQDSSNEADPRTGFRREALLTDLYELTMACAYWKSGMAEREACFQLFFRNHPFQSGYTIGAGLQDVIEYIDHFRFSASDLDYLSSLKGADGLPLFPADFLAYLEQLHLKVDIDAIPEGTLVFPHEPLLRVCGPILQGQLVEAALLNFVNFQSLVATKAARVCLAASPDPVIDFGMRRAQGPDGAVTAARAAYIGGCRGTSDVLAGKLLGIPVKGTHAHSWVMAFADERTAFERYAEALPNNCIFLVDTYDSLEGVRNAVKVGEKLRASGHRLLGVRLDSGDLAYLSIEARKILDAAGFTEAAIVGSNDLDEHLIASLKQQRAAINIWGVGTRLVTAYDQPALGGVYKLTAIRRTDGTWEHKLKLSEQIAKITTPGLLQVRRFQQEGLFIADAVYDQLLPIPSQFEVIDPVDPTRAKRVPKDALWADLLVPIFRAGKLEYHPPTLGKIREHAQKQLAMLHPSSKRLLNPHRYPAGLEQGLYELRTGLIRMAKNQD